jgi:hypothetical protein
LDAAVGGAARKRDRKAVDDETATADEPEWLDAAQCLRAVATADYQRRALDG